MAKAEAELKVFSIYITYILVLFELSRIAISETSYLYVPGVDLRPSWSSGPNTILY